VNTTKTSAASSAGGNPPLSVYDQKVLEWMTLGLEEGLSVNRREYHYDKIGESIDAIMGADEPIIRSPKLSKARLNKLQKIALELRSMLTDIKPFWTYEANSKRFEPQARILGKLAKNWYQRRGVDQAFRDAIDYVLVAGTGYLHLFWNPDLPGPSDEQGRKTQGDIDVIAEDPRDVIPFSLSGDRRSIQSAKGVFIRRERPTRWIKERYGARAANVKHDRMGYEKESPASRRQREAQDAVLETGGNLFSGQFFGSSPVKKLGGVTPVTDEFTVYLHDFTRNETDQPVEMGDWEDEVDEATGIPGRKPSNSWSYEVAPGDLLYPFGRRIVATRYGVMEDGPNHFQHGMFPVCKVTLDTWAWSWLGTTPIQSILPIQREVNETFRTIQDWIKRSGNRGMVYDKKAVPAGVAKKFNTRAPNQKLGINPHAQGPKGAVQIIEESEISKTIPEWLGMLIEQMDDLAGTASMKAFTQLGQIPSTESIDKIIDSMTPLVRARSRAMEVFIREFAMMLASMFMQFYDLNLRLRILGAEGATAEDWNYRPGDLLPDYIDDDDYETITGPDGTISTFVKDAAKARGPSPDYIRNREFLRFFDFNIAPGSLLDAATVTKKLLYLQLHRMGLMDRWTLWEELGVQNAGKPPSWATDIGKRLQAEQLYIMLGLFAPSGEGAAGRPPSGQSMPALNPEGGMTEHK
jgi:hypothetical protein